MREITVLRCTKLFVFTARHARRHELGSIIRWPFLSSLDFQTCRITDSPKSAGREVALEVGLETCAAAVRPRDVTHN